MTDLKTLAINRVGARDLSILWKLKSIQSIYAADNHIQNILPLVVSTNLLVADLRNNCVNMNNIDTQTMITSLESAGVTLLTSGQAADPDSKPTIRSNSVNAY